MKTIKILLGIIAINLTLLTIIQTGIWPPKVQASETNYSNVNYGLVPLNEDGSIDVNINSSAATMDVNLITIRGGLIGRHGPNEHGVYGISIGPIDGRLAVDANCYGFTGLGWLSMTQR